MLRRFTACTDDEQLCPGNPQCGLSGAVLWRLATPRGNLCLRANPANWRDASRVARIHQTLKTLSRNGCQLVPQPLRARDHRTWVDWSDRLWELSPWLPGKADLADDPSLQRIESALMTIGEFHRVAQTCGGCRPGIAPSVQQRLQFLERLKHGLLERIVRVAGNPETMENSPLAESTTMVMEALERLPGVLSQAAQLLAPCAERAVPLQVCHGDLWLDNLLFQGGRVSGLVDWGLLGIDTPASDLARLLGSLLGDRARHREAGLDAYARIRPLSGPERELVEVLDFSSPPLALLNWLTWILIERRLFPDWKAVRSRLEGLAARVNGRHEALGRRTRSSQRVSRIQHRDFPLS